MGDTSMIKIGPVGRNIGTTVWDEKGRSEIVQIFISHRYRICSILFQYVENGDLLLSNRHGQLTGDKFHLVKLNYPSEYLTGIRGWRDDFWIKSITFQTNLRTHGPFGRQPTNYEKEICFELVEDRRFGGFHGTANDGLSSIGVYIKRIPTSDANGSPVSF